VRSAQYSLSQRFHETVMMFAQVREDLRYKLLATKTGGLELD
jgi:hypothetical protein